MAQTKPKIELVKHKRKQSLANKPKESDESRLSEAVKKKEFWQQEISDLSNQQYQSLEAALEALVDKVLLRFPPPAEQMEATRTFLLELLQSDPTVEETLRKSLNIR